MNSRLVALTHLTERGEYDVLVLERVELTSGSTLHSAGLVGQRRADPTLTRMNTSSVGLYRRLDRAGFVCVASREASVLTLSATPRLNKPGCRVV